MPRLATLLKSAVLAGVTTFAASAAAAEDFTVYVYESGYFPNIVYSDDATRIKFVNETRYAVGIDTDPYGYILVRKIYSGSSAFVDVSTIAGRTVRTPYLYGQGRPSGEKFNIVSGSAPDS